MYKLVIADDELRIRTLLSNVINWNSLGFEVVGLFSDGKEVIEYIKHNQIDCVLCDICMTQVSGIDIAKYIYDNMPHIKVMLISGYTEFSYALAALKYGVENYFLKPVKVKEIETAFKVIKNKLDLAKNDSEIISFYRHETLINLVNGIYRGFESIKSAFDKAHINASPHDACAIVEFLFDSQFRHSQEILKNMFENVAFFNKSDVHVFFLYNNNISVKYILFSTEKNKDLFFSAAEGIRNSIYKIMNISSKIYEFKYFNSVTKFCESRYTLKEKRKIILKDQEEMLVSAINSGNQDNALEIFASISDYIINLSFNDAKKHLCNLTENCSDKLLETTKTRSDDDVVLKKYLKKLSECSNTNEIIKAFKECLTDLISIVNNMDIRKRNILRIRDYIEAHCTDDLSLDHVASLAYLSPTYFSMLFKNIVGQTYMDFLISCKMNKAKDMLINSRLKMNEISSILGYGNIRSFNKQFKSCCGFSPSEYRKKYAKDV